MGRRNNKFWESATFNNASYMQYYYRLAELAITVFKWSNLPDTVDPRFLELALFIDGKAVFFEDEEMGYLCLQCAVNGGFNVYRIPINRRAYAVNGYQKKLTINDSVIIYNNYLRTNNALDVEMFAKRLYNLDRTIDVNINAQKTPIMILCDETQRLTMQNMYMQYDGNQPFIFGDKSLNPKAMTVLNTDAPYVADKLFELKEKIWNEALTYLGITNLSVNKKERLISDEVIRNQGGTIASRHSRLWARQHACEKINKMFGLNIWCEYADSNVAPDESVVEENVEIYNRT